MPLYKVTYEAELEADSPEEAAESAWDGAQMDDMLPILTVTDLGTGQSTDVDLDAEDSGIVCPDCGTDDWDFTCNDRARCANGHQWQEPADDA